MNREELKDEIIGLLEGMSDSDKMSIYNEWCMAGDAYDDLIYDNDEYGINEFFGEEVKPYDVVSTLHYSDYNFTHDYFKVDGYGNLVSFYSISSDKSPFYADEIAEYIIDHDDALYNDDIRELLDSADEDDDFEESVRRPRRRINKESIRRNRRRYRK